MTTNIVRTVLSKLIFSIRTLLIFTCISLSYGPIYAQNACPTDSIPKVTSSVTAPICAGNATGKVILNIAKDSAFLKYKWQSDSGFIDSVRNISAITGGRYTLTVMNTRNLCDTTLMIVVPKSNDTVPPSVICPADIVKNLAIGECSAIITYSVTASDNCEATLEQTAGIPSGALFQIGQTRIAYKATDPSGNVSTCTFKITVAEYPTTGAISCISQTNMGISGICDVTITARDVIIGSFGCMARYSLSLYDGTIPLPDNHLRSGQIGKKITYRVTDLQSFNYCSGYINVTDNAPPIVERPSDIVLRCYQVAVGESPSTDVTGLPRVISDCTNLPTNTVFSDESFYAICSQPFAAQPTGWPNDVQFDAGKAQNCARIVIRTFTVSDFYKNETTCKQVIYVRNGDLNEVVCPVGVTVKCTGLPPNLLPDSVWINDNYVAGTGRPRFFNGIATNISGGGVGVGSCRIIANYSDKRWDWQDGSYFIDRTWLISDDCSGQKNACVQTITVEDSKPQVWCKTGFKTNILPDKTVKIKASDVIETTFDKCTPLERMKLGIRRAGQGSGFPDSTFLTFNCDNIGTQALEIWIKDETNLMAMCATTITIDDPDKNCSPPIPLSIAGKIVKENGIDVSADVFLINLKNTETQTANPNFAFSSVVKEQNYRVEARRASDWVNGVSTFDLVLMSKHVLGLEPLNSPYKRLAADLDRDGEVSGGDMLLLRKLILRQLDTIQGNRPWCFLPKNFQFLNTDYPAVTEFDENYVFSNIQDSVKNADFIAIKLGDVNLSAKGPRSFLPENMERTQPFIFKTKDIFLNKNEKTTLELTPSVELLENGLSAFQLTFNYDKNIDIEAIEAEGFYNFTQANYFIFKNENKIALSWNGKYVENPVLKLKITAKEALPLRGRLSISSDKTVAEAYDEVGTTMPIVLSFDNKKQENNYKLYQNIPNPFSAETTIVCAMPDDCEGQVTIFDVSGKVLKSIKTRFSSGFNQIKIDKNADLTEGVLFYRVETVFGILTQKMVVVR